MEKFYAHTRAVRNALLLSLTLFGCLVAIVVSFPSAAHAATLSSSPYTLTIENTDPTLQYEVTQLQNVFQYSYPKLVQRFGSATTANRVTLTIDPNGTGVAGTDAASAHITVNANYIKQNPDDLGWLTHELTHVVQNYQGSDVPGWFVEGMADYSRYYYAPAGANPSWWQIPSPPTSSDSYTEGYGPAARFLIWLQQRKSSTIVDQLNHAAQTQQVFATVFQKITGGTVDQLWTQYVNDPTIRESGVCLGGLQLSYSSSQWSGGFTGNLTIQNTGSAPVNGWNLVFTFPDTQQVTQGWNGVFSQQGNAETITNASYNGSIPVRASVNLGFNASWNGSNSNPTSFTLNGQPCLEVYS